MESSDEESYRYFGEDDSSSDDDDDIQIIHEKLVKIPATTDNKQDKSTYDEKDIEILKEILVKTPSTLMTIKKEKSSYRQNRTFTWVNGKLEKQSLLQPTKKIFENDASKDTLNYATKDPLNETNVEKRPAVTFESLASKAPFVMLTPKDKQQGSEKCRPALKLPRAIKRLQDWNNTGEKEKEIPIRPPRRKSSACSGLTITPVPINVSIGSRTGETTTGHISDEATRFSSQRNEPVKKRNCDNNQENDPAKKKNGYITGRIDDRAIGQSARYQGNLTVKIGNADMALTNASFTVKMKISDVSISGRADDVSNFVSNVSKTLIENGGFQYKNVK